MKEKKNEQKDKKPDEKSNFHVRFRPGTAEWLRRKVDRDARTVPAVVKRIVEKERHRDGD